ncbi:hypothetical protein [Stutzerimonas kunmingensis]|uniref:hypothetical protein n=1 Tax=Stutzerimonas kunmingensis TaxID=1211807 RepID=UPI002FCC206E
MAVYRVTAPDGSEFEITAPDDATEEQVLAYAQQQFAQQQQPPQPEAPQRTPEEQRALEDALTGTSLDPTAGQSFLTNAHQGLGKFFADTGRGVGQMTGMVSQQDVDAARLRDEPLNNTWGGVLGQGAGAMATLAIPGAGAARLAQGAGRAAPYLAAAATGGGLAGLQPVATGETRAGNAATGAALGAAGQAVASGLGVLATKAASAVNPVVARSIEAARAAGIPLNVAQVTDSAPIRALQAATRYLPFAGATKASKAQQEAFNRAVGKSFGADASVLSDDVMKAARQKLGAEFDDIYSRNDVAVTPDVMRRLLAIEREAGENLVPEEAQIVRNQIERIVRKAQDGVMSGRAYQGVRSAIQTAEKKGGDIGRLIKGVRSELDDAAAQSVGPDDAARLAKVRGGWANLRMTEEALSQVAGSAGNVRPAALWPLIRKGSTKEMRELAKIGQNVLKETIGDSGTGPRTLYQSLLTGSVGAGGLMAGGTAGAVGALTGLGKLAAVGAVAGKALNTDTASRLLAQGKPTAGLARLAKPLPRLLPAGQMVLSQDTPLNIGTVSGYDPNDPRYQGR